MRPASRPRPIPAAAAPSLPCSCFFPGGFLGIRTTTGSLAAGQCGVHERLLLLIVQLIVAGGRCGRALAARVEQLVTIVQRFLQAMPDLVPGTLVLRLLLAPDDVTERRVFLYQRSIAADREGIQLLDPHDGD